MTMFLAIVGSGLGALARYGLSGAIQRRVASTRPWGTAAVNVLGALALALLVGLHAADRLGGDGLAVAGTGFCGGFTTFSTWMVESVRLGQEGGAGLRAMVVNVAGMLLLGVVAVAVGASLPWR